MMPAAAARAPAGGDDGRGGGQPPPAAPPPAVDISEWVAAESRGGLDVGDSLPPSAVVEMVNEDRRLARLRSGLCVAVGCRGSVELRTPRIEHEATVETRVLPVRCLVGGDRGRAFGETIKLFTESPAADWRVSGPRATRWSLQAIAAQGYSRLQRHYWWRNIMSLAAADLFVDDHLFISEHLETGLVFDQLNVPELAIFETIPGV